MSKQNGCAGTYPVSGYTREDGTKVNGYMRTCGAKHAGGYNLEDVVRTIEKYSAPKIQEGLTGEKLSERQEFAAKHISPFSSTLKYYRLSLDYENVSQFDKDNSYTTFGKIGDSEIQAFIKEKYKDCNITDSTPVVTVHLGTPLANSLANSDLFNNAIQKHSEMIRNGDTSAKNFSLSFTTADELELCLVLGKCNVYKLRPDNYCDTTTGAVIDYYDFSKLGPSSSYKKAFINAANNNAVIQQDNGHLTNYILIIPFVLFENSDI